MAAAAVLSMGWVAAAEESSRRADGSFWSFQPVRDPQPPRVKDEARVQSPIDQFVLAKLEEVGLTLAPPADRLTLVRRLSFDLTGLPPSPELVDAFLSDEAPNAFEKLVDRLLASPQYGERWGRHWLDVARYADTAGESADYPIPQAWKYRNWVIRAFNEDKPYDEFLTEQIAGDLLEADDAADREAKVVATGFIAQARRFSVDPDGAMHQTIEDTLNTLGQATMGLTLSCARCHDHKFDPVSMRDYYALYGIFGSTRFPFPGSENKKRQRDFVPLVPESEVQRVMAPFAEQLAKLDAELDDLKEEGRAIRDKAAGRTPKREPKHTNLTLLEEFRGVRARRDKLQDQLPEIPAAYAVADETKPADAPIQLKGEPFNRGETVPRGFLAVLGGQKLPPEEKGSGRRELAGWIATSRNPLTARVMVNRVWQGHFGRGLVSTPNDFGKMGRAPSHPDLLDWLATRFVEDGWSVKRLHRRILLSAAWQQQVIEDARASELDPNNERLWRANRLRLDAEAVRDSLLWLSGNLDLLPGEGHPFPPQKTWSWTQHNPFTAVYDTDKRSVYVMQQRIRRHPFFATFDGADTNATTGSRFITTTPLQALFSMNDPFAHAQAEGFARRVVASAPHDVARVEVAHRLALGRPATAAETAEALVYLAECRARRPVDDPQAALAAWTSYARILMGSNEFMFVE